MKGQALSDAVVGNIGICEIEDYRGMQFGLRGAAWTDKEFSVLVGGWVGDDVAVDIDNGVDVLAAVGGVKL